MRVCEIGVVGLAGLSVGEGASVQCDRQSAGGPKDGVAGGSVPFHGSPETGIDVRPAFRQQAEFQRRSDGADVGDPAGLEKIVCLRRVVGSACDRDGSRGDGPGADRVPRLDREVAADRQPAGAAAVAAIGDGKGGCVDDAGNGSPVLDQGDVDGEFGAPGDEFPGSVEGIDQNESLAGNTGDTACGRCFLGDNRNVRKGLGQDAEDDPLGALVRFGHRGAVRLVAGCRAAVEDLQDEFSGFQCGMFEEIKHCRHEPVATFKEFRIRVASDPQALKGDRAVCEGRSRLNSSFLQHEHTSAWIGHMGGTWIVPLQSPDHGAAFLGRQAGIAFPLDDRTQSLVQGGVLQGFEPEPQIIGFVPRHVPERRERQDIHAVFRRSLLRPLDQPATDPLSLMSGMDRDLVDMQCVWSHFSV